MSSMSDAEFESLAELPNLGPRSAEMLAAIGITELAQLKELGAVQAYLAVKQNNPNASLNLLWAIAGALRNQRWDQLDQDLKSRLLEKLNWVDRG